MLDISSIYIEEKRYSDTIFKNVNSNLSSAIEDNIDYSDVNSKTWYYTNIRDMKAWVDDGIFPVPVSYSSTMFNNEKQAVFIVKRYVVKSDNFYAINILLRYIENKEYNCNILHDHISNYTRALAGNDDLVVRIVYTIPAEVFKEREIVKTHGVVICKDIRDLVSEECSNTGIVGEHSFITYKVSYYSAGRKPFEIPHRICNARLKPNFTLMDDMVVVETRGNDGDVIFTKEYTKEDFLNGAVLNTVKNHDQYDAIVDKYIDKHKEVRDWIKLFIDKDISLNKVVSSSINNLIAESKLEKEDLALSREGLKTIKDLLL